jgi:glycine/D-amino acid oxidase-like deaminating enzyme
MPHKKTEDSEGRQTAAMTAKPTNDKPWWYRETAVAAEVRPRLTFDLDVEVCVVGGGVAGLSIALEAARRGASVAVLEANEIGWNASGCNLGTVTPGFGGEINDLIARIGIDHARDLWALSQSGVEWVRQTIATSNMPDVALTDGVLEVSHTDIGDQLIGRLQLLGETFGADVEGWQVERVRDTLKTQRYFHAIHYPKAFHVHALNYLRGLAALAEKAGVQIFEHTPVTEIDPAGVRKRIGTPQAKLRASTIVLAGNVHLGAAFPRLSRTLLPVWRYAAVTGRLGDKLAEAIAYRGAVSESSGVDHYRIVDGDRLMWTGPVTTWQADPRRFRRSIERRIHAVYPQFTRVRIADIWSGTTGETVHGMPQIGQLSRGLWIASGFGRQGLSTAGMAAEVIVGGMLARDDRWRLFAPFELVWTGGPAGRFAGQMVYSWQRRQAAMAGVFARYRERAGIREQRREARLAAANQAVRNMHVAGQGPRPRDPGHAAPRQDADLAGS